MGRLHVRKRKEIDGVRWLILHSDELLDSIELKPGMGPEEVKSLHNTLLHQMQIAREWWQVETGFRLYHEAHEKGWRWMTEDVAQTQSNYRRYRDRAQKWEVLIANHLNKLIKGDEEDEEIKRAN